MDWNTTAGRLPASKAPNETIDPWSAEHTSVRAVFIILLTLECAAMLCLFFGNTLVIVAFCRFSKVRKTMTNYFLFGLAVADISFGLGSIFGVVEIHLGVWYNHKYTCLVNEALTVLSLHMTVFSLFGVAVDRLIAIAWPFFYPAIVTGKRVLVINIIAWILFAAVASLPLFGVNNWDAAIGCFPFYVLKKNFLIVSASSSCVLLCITFGIYVYIFRVAKCHFESMVKDGVYRKSNGHKPSLTDLKAAKMLLVIVAVFVVCWGTGFCTLGVVIGRRVSKTTSFILEFFTHILLLLSSALNPLIYSLKSHEFRLAFQKLLRRGGVVNDHDLDSTCTTRSSQSVVDANVVVKDDAKY